MAETSFAGSLYLGESTARNGNDVMYLPPPSLPAVLDSSATARQLVTVVSAFCDRDHLRPKLYYLDLLWFSCRRSVWYKLVLYNLYGLSADFRFVRNLTYNLIVYNTLYNVASTNQNRWNTGLYYGVCSSLFSAQYFTFWRPGFSCHGRPLLEPCAKRRHQSRVRSLMSATSLACVVAPSSHRLRTFSPTITILLLTMLPAPRVTSQTICMSWWSFISGFLFSDFSIYRFVLWLWYGLHSVYIARNLIDVDHNVCNM